MKSFELQNHKKAFSLAEGMVMLIVVSILLAVSAPLIAKKTQTDAQKFWYKNGSNVLGIMGANQKLGIGVIPAADSDGFIPKVTIKSTNKDAPLFEALPGKSNPTNEYGFRVYSDGTTNITGRPNFNYGLTLPGGETLFKAPDNGYIYLQNAINSTVSFMKTSSTSTSILEGTVSAIGDDEILLTPTFEGSSITAYPVLIPVYKNGQDIKVNCASGDVCMFFKHAKPY